MATTNSNPTASTGRAMPGAARQALPAAARSARWPRLADLAHLPRDTRDTLFLLTVIAWIVLPQAGYLPWWCSAMVAVILAWRATIALRGQALPSRWWLLGLLLLATLATLLTYRTILGRDAGVTFIVVLLALKTLELRARRDAFVVFFLGFFALLSHFFFSQSLLTAAGMLLGVWGLLTALVNSHMPVGRPSLVLAAKTAGGMALLGAPIMVVLFMLFPRIAPLWGLPSDTASGRSGLSGTMQVGTVASLALDSSVAMRIQFEGEVPPRDTLYFRGPVLSNFDGREWRPNPNALWSGGPASTQLAVQGEPLRYEVTLEGNQRPWLLTLDATPQSPELVGFRTMMTRELQWMANKPFTAVTRYRAQSHTRYQYGVQARTANLQDYLDLPEGFNPRTVQLAQDLARENPRANPADMVPLVLERLRTGGYLYTLEPGVYGMHTADEFWFDRKEGFCEHIASSFVILMRALGVPARVVTGYQGGERNGVDGLWTVRQSDAHAWTEIWLEGQGWQRVDPTASVAPGRTGSLQRLEAPRNAFTQALITVNPRFVLNLRELWEATNSRWNQWILNYSQSRQLDLLRNLGFDSPSWHDLSYVLIALIVGTALLGAAWAQWERLRQDPWLRLLSDARLRLQRRGLPLASHLGPRSMAQAIAQAGWLAQPDMAAVHAWLLRMEQCRYSPQPQTHWSALRREYRQLRWARPQPSPAPLAT